MAFASTESPTVGSRNPCSGHQISERAGPEGARRRGLTQSRPEVAAANRPARGAAITNIIAPQLAAGGEGEVTVTLVNRGSQTWTANMRLAAAAGCPDATAANELEWLPTDGYANGILDARVFLPHDVAPGESIELTVPAHPRPRAPTCSPRAWSTRASASSAPPPA